MKAKKIALFLGLATIAWATVGQENPVSPPSDAPPPEQPASPDPAAPPADAVPAPAVDASPAPDPTQAPVAPDAAAPNAQVEPVATAAPDEIVPLIVIDDVPLTDAIRNLARQAGLNFQFDPRITAVGADGRPTNQFNVSIRFENVTAQEALSAVLDNYGLKLEKEPGSKIARVTYKDPQAQEPLISAVIQLKYANPTNIVSVLKPAFTDKRSEIVPDGRTAKIIITATAKELVNVTNLVTKIDVATRQVLIEAQLLETGINPKTVKGIDWSGTLEHQNITMGNNALPGTPGTPYSPPVAGPNGTLIPAQPAEPGTIGGILSDPKLLMNASSGSFFNPSMAFLNADGVSAVLSFLNKDSDTEVVATPRAVTLDNQTATLSVTRAFPIFNITPGSANSPAGANIQYTNLGTILNVTPRIAADDNISLRVVPEVSNIDFVDKQLLNDTENTANVYAIRKMETTVMIPSGNTLVLGGLINDTKNDVYTKVPILGDLPGVGLLFRHESKERKKQNLIIFITPTIIEDGDFHRTESGREYLANRVPTRVEKELSDWDSAKPHDWTKPQY